LSDLTELLKKAARIELAVFDVDGVLTNGELIYTGNHQEQKVFHAHDGLGLKMLLRGGCEVAIISSRKSAIVDTRMAELGIGHVYQGVEDKRGCLLALMAQLGIARSGTAYTGDDLIDLPAMRQAGLAIAVANAQPYVMQHADWVTSKSGGSGAAREVCDLILKARGKLDALLDEFLR
jgi:3-deoxy-D-manno-octulosonate 8-phosphate phosphatase (KDO 8-P phosphatase)